MAANLQTKATGKVSGFLEYVGNHSLEIYLIYYLLLNMIELSALPLWPTAAAVALVAVNYALTLVSSIVVANLLNTNKLMHTFLFGKP